MAFPSSSSSAKRDQPPSRSASSTSLTDPNARPYDHAQTHLSSPIARAVLRNGTAASSTDTLPNRGEEDTEGFTKVLTKEEKRKQRKVEKHRPSFSFDLGQFRNGKKITIAHIRDLVLFLVADGQKPLWIVPEHKAGITHTVILLVPGLLPSHLGLDIPISANHPFPTNPILQSHSTTSSTSSSFSSSAPSQVPYLGKIFSYGVPTRAPGDSRRMFSVVSALMNSPLPEAVRKKKEAEDRRIAELAKSDDSPPFLYLLTPNQMIDNDYKLPSYVSAGDKVVVPGLEVDDAPTEIAEAALTKSNGVFSQVGQIKPPAGALGQTGGQEGWRETAQAESPPSNGKYPIMAIDCEMVETSQGAELARISVVDYQTGQNVFDRLVKPAHPVTDYRTKWSGMTEARLSQAQNTLQTVQSALYDGAAPLITPHTILLGHSLECDLNALRIRHPLCIDTALLFKHPRGPPYKPALKWLAGKWLGKEIQNMEGGHDSEEDARTCVELLKLKVANGPDFGAFNDSTEAIFERMSRFIPSGMSSGRTSAVCDYSSPRSGHGSKATTATKFSDDEEVLGAMLAAVESHDFVFGRFLELGNIQGWNGEANIPQPSQPTATTTISGSSTANGTSPTSPSGITTPSSPPQPLSAALERFNARLTRLHQALPRSSALILLTGHADPMPMLALTAKRQKWERLTKERGGADGVVGEERWLGEDDRELERRVAEAREGMAFFCVK